MKIIKGFSTIRDGNMKIYPGNIHNKENENTRNKENRKLLLKKVGLDDSNLVLAGLVHGNKIVVVSSDDKGKVVPDCDGFITNIPGIILGVTAADCVPVYFWDKNKNVIGMVHAGWRGVQKDIMAEMINLFINNYDCLVGDIEVEIGPHIKDCHFEVQEDVIENFTDYSDYLRIVEGKKYLSLGGIIIKQLLLVGIRKENIRESSDCTFCEKEKYFSYRRDKPEDIEAMMGYIAIV
jgi:YfiH family protein